MSALTVLMAVVVIPPLVSVNRYKGRITRLMSASLGRPVRLSSVELRVLPRPGFVLTDLTVDEDADYGAEPVLHANTVVASIRLLPLWRGRLEISRISVDEASLNLVQTAAGRWNLDPFFRSAASHPGEANQSNAPALPYLEATNSRINIKRGFEKLPYSLVSADLSFWQEEPGDWRVRLRGQPARTDVMLDLADTGLVQLEARLRRAPELRAMPVHVDMEWREAQLGQLSKLVLGSDPGWRGNLTGEMHMDGTAASAQITTRLRATGVHRAEFAPAAPLDFDATCGFVYDYSALTLDNLVCESPLGDGHVKLAGNLPASGKLKLTVEMDRVPAQAALDALRTVRNGIAAQLEARGSISGKLDYDPAAPASVPKETAPVRRRSSKVQVARGPIAKESAHGALSGSLVVDGFVLRGDGLSQPVQIPKITLQPALVAAGDHETLAASVAMSAGAVSPLLVTVHMALAGYQFTVRGPGSVARMREFARAANLPDAAALNAFAGEPVVVELSAAGPWLPALDSTSSTDLARTASAQPASAAPGAQSAAIFSSDSLVGTVTLRNANWKSDALATAVQIPQATLHIGSGPPRWDPVTFSYGPLKGTASLQVPAACEAPAECPPQLNFQFATLNADALQSALLGAHKSGSLLSTVIARLSSPAKPAWPSFIGTVRADALVIGPVTLHNAVIALKVTETGADLTSLDAGILGGQLHGTGKINNGDKPTYSLEGEFREISPAVFCGLLRLQCTGTGLDGTGKVDLSGFTDKDLGASAKGTFHFDWRRGSVVRREDELDEPIPPALARFDHWSGDAEIANGVATLKQNQVQQGRRKTVVETVVTLGNPPRVSFTPPAATIVKK